jgi:hypothetical protein
MASWKGKGKSGGYRTIHYFGGDDVPLFLLALVVKGQRANISAAERNELVKLLPRIVESYRENVAENLKSDRTQS